MACVGAYALVSLNHIPEPISVNELASFLPIPFLTASPPATLRRCGSMLDLICVIVCRRDAPGVGRLSVIYLIV